MKKHLFAIGLVCLLVIGCSMPWLYPRANVSWAGFLPIRDSSGGVVIGKQLPDSAQYCFDGVISGVQIYDRTLTPQEIADHYNATK